MATLRKVLTLKQISCYLIVWVIFSVGCRNEAQEQKAPRDNNFVIITLVSSCKELQNKNICLPNDYGFLINWPGDTKPEFYLYNKLLKTITFTDDFTDFLDGLKQFPTGAKIDRIEKCQVPFSYYMPDAEREQLDDIIKNKRFVLTDQENNNFIICTCEYRDINLLKATR